MPKYLIKTMKLYDSKSGDWCQESDWMYVDSDKINVIEIFGKRFVAEENTDAPTIKTESQRAYEQGVKDTLDKYDEDFRIASEIRIAVGCETAKECWELARNGDIQVVKHGRWIPVTNGRGGFECSVCTNYAPSYRDGVEWLSSFCPNCGADMREVGENEL